MLTRSLSNLDGYSSENVTNEMNMCSSIDLFTDTAAILN